MVGGSEISRILAKAKMDRVRCGNSHSAVQPFPITIILTPGMGSLESTGDLVVAVVWDDLGIKLDGV